MDLEEFDSTNSGCAGIYIINYVGEGICKLGVTVNLRDRARMLQSGSWAKIDISSFVFPVKSAAKLGALADDYNILWASSYELESLCHKQLKELDCHVRGEFFSILPDDAKAVMAKVADVNGFRLATPQMVAGMERPANGRADDDAAFYELVNAAAAALEVMADFKDEFD